MGNRRRGSLYRLEVTADRGQRRSRTPTRPRPCGSVCSAAATSAARWPRYCSPAPRTSPPVPASAWSSSAIAVANPERPRPVAIPADLIGTDAAALVGRADVDVVVEVDRGPPSRARTGRGRPAQRQARGHRQQGAPGRRRRRAGRGGRRSRGGPALRGGRGRRHPRHPAPARVAGRGADRPRHGDRQRHDELHPHPHGGGGRRLRRRPARGPGARSGRARPDGRRGGPRRRGQGGHPGRARLRQRRRRRRRPPRGHQRRSARPTSPTPAGWATPSSSSPSPS